MKAELKRIHSPDVWDLEAYKPEQVDSFGILIQAMVGPEGRDGEESFDIQLCTPKWLEANYEIEGVVIGRHHLIVQRYDYSRLVQAITNFLHDCQGDNWKQISQKVSRLGKWEFEDYEKSKE